MARMLLLAKRRKPASEIRILLQGSGVWGLRVEAVDHVAIGYDEHEGAIG